MSDYIKLATAPTLTIHMPTCDACHVEVDADADGLTCPCCGTSWGHRDGEGDPGTLYEDWAGEDLYGPTLDEDEARKAGDKYDAEKSAAFWADMNARATARKAAENPQ